MAHTPASDLFPARPRVLLVGTGSAFAQGLRARGFEVGEAVDLVGAMEQQARQPAQVLAAGPPLAEDAVMALFHAAEERSPATLKILLATDVALHTLAESLNRVRVDFFLVPPFTLDELQQAIEHVWGVRKLERERDLLHRQNERMMDELRALNSGLEQRVRERTDELAQTNARLAEALREIEQKNRALTLLNESLNIQATVDPLTGLFNRREFRSRLLAEWARFKRYRRPTSVLMLDIDWFKKVNDTHGHEAGDSVLQGLGAILRGHQRRHDVPCRYGGEEFVVLLPETLLESAFLVADGIRRRVENHVFRYKEQRLTVTISLGVAGALEQNPADADAFVNLADKALYRAKADGRNRTVVLEPGTDRVLRASA